MTAREKRNARQARYERSPEGKATQARYARNPERMEQNRWRWRAQVRRRRIEENAF